MFGCKTSILLIVVLVNVFWWLDGGCEVRAPVHIKFVGLKLNNHWCCLFFSWYCRKFLLLTMQCHDFWSWSIGNLQERLGRYSLGVIILLVTILLQILVNKLCHFALSTWFFFLYCNYSIIILSFKANLLIFFSYYVLKASCFCSSSRLNWCVCKWFGITVFDTFFYFGVIDGACYSSC